MEYYDYPMGEKISPFEAADGGNYFAKAGKITYLATYEELGNIKSMFDDRNKILSEAYVLSIFKRYALIENGHTVYKNSKFFDGHDRGASRYKSIQFMILTNVLHVYKVDSWKNRPLESYSINSDDGSYNCSLGYKLFTSPEDAIQYAEDVSKDKDMKCIVAQWFSDIDRH